MPDVDLIVAPVSGGGLLSGTATAVKLSAPKVQVWGAEPALAADAKESFETRQLVKWPAEKTTRTIGDGLRTQSMGALNFEHVIRYVDGIAAVSEEEILSAMRIMLRSHEAGSGAQRCGGPGGGFVSCSRVAVRSKGRRDDERRKSRARAANATGSRSVRAIAVTASIVAPIELSSNSVLHFPQLFW